MSSNYIESVNIPIRMSSYYIASVNILIEIPSYYITSIIFTKLLYFIIFSKVHCLLAILAVSLLYFKYLVKNFLNCL